jgi:hypothetical protein
LKKSLVLYRPIFIYPQSAISMESSFLTSSGRLIIGFAQLINLAALYIFTAVFALVVAALLLRFIVDALRLSPFGRFAYYASRPGNEMLRNMRQSRFYFPLKRAFGFDPSIPMLLVATAILCYIAYTIVTDVTTVLLGLANTLIAFGAGDILTGVVYLVGTVLLAGVVYLMLLMTLIFFHWISGWLRRPAYRALERIGPLLSIFEFGGALAGFSFLILWLVLLLAKAAIQFFFFSGLRTI